MGKHYILFVKILHLAFARCRILTNIMPTHAKIRIEPGIRELFFRMQASMLILTWVGMIFVIILHLANYFLNISLTLGSK